jgi:hypothetical protein
MTIEDLIVELNKHPKDAKVLVSSNGAYNDAAEVMVVTENDLVCVMISSEEP